MNLFRREKKAVVVPQDQVNPNDPSGAFAQTGLSGFCPARCAARVNIEGAWHGNGCCQP